MNNKEYTKLIEAYLDGKLQGNDLKNFELKLQTDKEFALDYSVQKNIRETLIKKDVFELREKLDKVREDFEKEKQSRKKRTPVLFYAISAIIAIVVIVTICFFNKSYTNDELYFLYFERYDAGTITRGDQETTADIYTLALRSYDLEKYNVAIELFNEISDSSDFFIQKEYFEGLSYMGLQKFDEAIKHLNTVISDKQNAYYDNAIWYTGLCYLKKGQKRQSIQQFRKLLNKDSYLYKRASEILEKMK